MIPYAGIGSRSITETEQQLIERIAKKLSKHCVVYSGNADGADIAFQTGSAGKCVIMLPWKNFNRKNYSTVNALASYDLGKSIEGNKAVDEHHPAPTRLSPGARLCIARNYHQIMGYDKYPPVKFVVCCANVGPDMQIIGGTGHACRLAEQNGIPVFNIRSHGWDLRLHRFVKGLLHD